MSPHIALRGGNAARDCRNTSRSICGNAAK
jgi:hypothetical protein